MRFPIVLPIALLTLFLAACTIEGVPKGELELLVQGLPPGTEARVVLQKGEARQEVKASGVYALEAGTWTVQAYPVEVDGVRYNPEVATASAEVKPRSRVQVSVVYQEDPTTIPGTLSLLVQGLPPGADASIRIRGDGYEATFKSSTNIRLRPGAYLLEAFQVSYGGKTYLPEPDQLSFVVEPGKVVNQNVLYREEVRTGELLVNITGLPSGTEARVRVLDGNGTAVASLTKSRLLTLPAGTYFVEADPVGTYVPQVSGSPANVQAGVRAEVQVSYQNQPQSLSLTLNPTALTVPPGSTGTLQATLQAQNFSGQVNLVLQGAPSGVTIAPTSASAPGQVALTLSVASSVAPGTYPITLQATGQGVSASASFTLSVPRPDFAFSLSPQSLSLAQGQSTTLLASITPQSGFSGQIAFSLVSPPAGFSLSGGPVSPSGPVDVPLTLSVASSVTPGTYTLVVKAEGGGVEKTQTVSVQVSPSTLSLTLEPTSLTISRGATGTLRATLTPQNFQGQVNLSLQGAPSGVSVSPGTVQVSGTTQATLTLSVGTSVAPGTYLITLTAQGQGVSASAGFSLVIPQPDFTFSLSPQSVSVSQGQSATLVASVVPQNGFSGQISFSLVNPPAGFSLSGGPVSPNGPADVPLVLSVGTGVAPGTYSLVVEAKGGGVSRTQTLSVQVSPSTGQLALSILFEGAPAGTEGDVVVSGPGGHQVKVTRSQVLTLPPGTYTITAYAITVEGTQYNPNPPGGTVEVQAGQTAYFTITYRPQ